MGPRWYDRACEQLEADFASGVIGIDEFNAEMRDLNHELRAEAEEAARSTYDDYMGGWR